MGGTWILCKLTRNDSADSQEVIDFGLYSYMLTAIGVARGTRLRALVVHNLYLRCR